ncbi:MAG TPA: peptidyl-prolyl cis-trans isomerase, partial [Solirubrobacteraceae bacterium]
MITSNWLIHEAGRQGVPIEDATVEEALAERKAEGGEFQKHLRASGQTLAGVELEMRAELAAEAVRERLAEEADNVTERELRDYYRRNRAKFSAPEARITDLVENLPSSEAAAALVRRIGTAKRFPSNEWHERVTQTPEFESTREKTAVVNAIFAARPGVISRPVRLNNSWAVFVVRKVLPPVPHSFADVHNEVVPLLRVARQHQLKARFDHQYQAYWRAKTTCRPEYVAPGCPQFHRQLGPYEDPFSSRAHPLLS